MTKFILIDQSIKDAGGHHLEYALRVLKAAKNTQFSTVLATNKASEHFSSEHIDIVDYAFTHSFWENYQSETSTLEPEERHFLKIIKSKADLILYSLLCSPIGFAYIAASQSLKLSDIFNRYGTSRAGKRLSPLTIVLGFFLARSACKIKNIVKKLRGSSSLAKKIYRLTLFSFAGLIVLTILPILLPLVMLRFLRFLRRSDIYASRFADDLQKLLIRVNAADGDIVFIPTLGNVELAGSAICANRFPVVNLSWHFLFRRNLFQGRENSYQHQLQNQLRTLQAYDTFKQYAAGVNASFYTDTVPLTEQYNSLGIFEFKTLPIPLDNFRRHIDHEDSKLNITYIGDARDEKGFPLLSRLVADLRAAGYSSNDIHFVFQSNFNVLGGEPGSRITRAELNLEPPDFVSLADGPFDSSEYTSLINNADILLIPYDRDNYYARSSGVFAEALAAGIPVIASNKSWMSRELLPLNHDYYKHLLSSSTILQSHHTNFAGSNFEVTINPHSIDKNVWILVEVMQLFEKPGSFINIRWKTSPEWIHKADVTCNYFHCYTLDLRISPAYALLRLPARKYIQLNLEIDDGSSRKRQLEVADSAGLVFTAHELLLPHSTPLFKVGALYCDEEDLSVAAIEVIEHHKQYVESAEEQRNTWKDFHSADTLVAMLNGVSK